MTDRRRFLAEAGYALAGLGVAGLLLPRRLFALTPPDKVAITVYKSSSCGCCGLWVTHMNANGFEAKVINVDDQARLEEIKTTSGVPVAMRSCHLALVGAYAVEGHVPADLVHKMLREKPQARGLSVPGMIPGTPGMETPGVPPRPYEVQIFQRDGSHRVYASR